MDDLRRSSDDAPRDTDRGRNAGRHDRSPMLGPDSAGRCVVGVTTYRRSPLAVPVGPSPNGDTRTSPVYQEWTKRLWRQPSRSESAVDGGFTANRRSPLAAQLTAEHRGNTGRTPAVSRPTAARRAASSAVAPRGWAWRHQ